MKRRNLFRLLSASAVLTLGGVGYAAARRGRNPYYHGPESDHFDGTRFFNPGHATDKGLRQLLSWQFGGGRAAWPASYPSPFAGETPPERVEGLRITLVGHASLLIQTAGLNILVDPVFARRASPFRFAGPKRVNEPGVAWKDLPPIDAVLLTHNHYDHLDGRTLARLWARFHPRVIAPLGNDAVLAGYDPSMVVETLDWGGSAALSDAVTVHLVPAQHWSARGTRDRRMALWGGYVIETPAGTVYHVGDTGYGDGAIFRAVRETFGPPRVLVVPIGAYEPRWFMRMQHVNPDEAVRIFLDTGAEEALGVHWGTFRLTNEGIEQPPTDLAAALAEHGIAPERFRAMRPGEVWEA